MNYLFPSVMLICGVSLIILGHALIGCLLAFFAAVMADNSNGGGK